MRLRPRQGLLLGIAILAAGSVVLEIAIARTLAAMSGQHLALAVPTLALAGAGLGGAIVGAFPTLVRRPALLARMSALSGAAAGAVLAAVLVLVHVRVPDVLDRQALQPVLIVYLSMALPFLLVGLAIAAAVRHVPVLAGRVVFALFSGAALGAPLALGALRTGGPRAALFVVAAYALASFVFYLAARSAPDAVERPRGAMVATFLLAATVLVAGDVGAPWLKLPFQRFSPMDKIEAQEWSVLGLVAVDKAQSGIAWIHTDGTSAAPIYDAKTTVPAAPDEMPYALLRDQGPVAILGGGGGREAKTAVRYGQKQIDAVDLDPILLRAFMLDRYKKASGDVYDGAQVKASLDAGRGFVRRAPGAYRAIVLALPDAQTAQAAGVLAAEPVDLYTVEAFADLLDHLTPDGMLAATRLDAEADRLVVLAAAALRATGITTPAQHLYACSSSRTTTLLVHKAAFTPSDVNLLRSFCRRNKLNEVFASDTPLSDQRRRLTADLDGYAPVDKSPAPPASTPRPRPLVVAPPAEPFRGDVRAPTGDRPFFASVIPPRLWVHTLLDKASAKTAQAVLVLWGILAVAVALVFFSVGLPLSAWPRWPVRRARSLLFFTGVGAALGFAAMALVPRLTVLMGHPIYAYTTVLPALLASLGTGGLVVARLRADQTEKPMGVRTELLVAVLALAAVALGPLVDVALAMPFALRFLAVALVLVPVGVLAGSLLALGMRQVGATSPPLVPWCWGMAAVGAFLAAALALPAAMALGYAATLLAGGLCALLAAACVPKPAR
jgi:hypothetical protein